MSFDIEKETESFAECGCPTHPIEGGMVDVIHFENCEYHDPERCEACKETEEEARRRRRQVVDDG